MFTLKQVTRALDSLRTPPTTDKHIIDCTLASYFTRLQGARAVLGDDSLFDRVCNMLSGNQLGDCSEKTEITCFVESKKFMTNFFTVSGRLVPGVLCYLEQLKDYDEFEFNSELSGLTLSGFVSLIRRDCVYAAKHKELTMRGLNTIMIDSTNCVFFEEGQGLTALTAAAKLVVDELDADLTDDEIKMGVNTQTVPIYNSIKYKNKVEAQSKILSGAIYQTPDFTKVFACAATIKTRDEAKTKVSAFLRSLQSKGGTDWIKVHNAIKSLPIISQSTVLEGIDSNLSTDAILLAIAKKNKSDSKL